MNCDGSSGSGVESSPQLIRNMTLNTQVASFAKPASKRHGHLAALGVKLGIAQVQTIARRASRR